MATDIWFWVAFNMFVLAMLALDLGVFHRHAHAVGMREAAGWSAFWIALALIFNAGIYWYGGSGPALEFLTGYLIEKSLSVDNIFVFVMIFTAFGVPAVYQHRVLFWGILGALVLRGAMIAAGAYIVHQFEWVLYLFGAFLVITGIRMAVQGEQQTDIQGMLAVRVVRRLIPVTPDYVGGSFFVRDGARLFATPLLVVLALVDVADVLFAVDSIPAIFAITQDPFLVYTSNVFAILGMRALYFLLAGSVDQFHYLKHGLAAVLVFVGTKMLIVDFVKLPAQVSLGVIGGILAVAIVASLLRGRRQRTTADEEEAVLERLR